MHSVRTRRGDVFMSNIDSTSTMVAKASPALVGTGWSFTQLPLADIAAILTIVYTLFLISDWVYKKYKAYKEWKRLS